MQINKFIITEEFLNSMSEDEKIFAVQLGYFLNEINILVKCTRIKPKSPPYRPEGIAEFCFVLMFIRLLASKLYEAWRFIKTWNKKNKKAFFLNEELPKWLEPILSNETKEIWEKIDNYFKNTNNILVYIRNRAGFHYDKELIKKGLQQLKVLKNTQALTYFTSEYAENSLFVFSDMIILQALKKKICTKNCQEICQETSPGICQKGKVPILKKLIDETEDVLILFHRFSMNCLDEIAAAKNIHLEPVEEINISNPPSYNDINFPFFIRREEEE